MSEQPPLSPPPPPPAPEPARPSPAPAPPPSAEAPDPLPYTPLATVPGFEPEPGWARRAMLLSQAFSAPLRRATWTGAAVAAVVAIAIALLLGTAPALLVGLVCGAVGAAAGVGAGMLAMGSADRTAFESFGWLGRRELDRVQERAATRVPTDPAGAARWLAENPPGPATSVLRVELLCALGRLAEAQAEMATYPAPTTASDAVEQAISRRHVRYLATRVLDDAELDALEPTLRPGSGEALEIQVARAVGETRRRLDVGVGDWREPLLAVRPALGPEATTIMLSDVWRKLAISLGGVCAVAGLVIAMAH